MESTSRTTAKLKRRLNTAITEVTSIYNTGKAAMKENDKYGNTFKSMYTSLEKYYSIFEDCFDELAVLSEEDIGQGDGETPALTFPSTEDTNNKATLRKYYYEIKTMYIAITSPPPPPSTSNQLLETTLGTTVVHETSVRLPEIKLTPFNGDILNWPKFRDTYLSIVHEDKTLSLTQKFHYLVTSLSGPARSIINQFQISDQNYPLAWQAVLEAYDKKRLLATAYLNRILNFHPIQGKPSLDSLKSFVTSVCDSVSAFELLGIEQESKFILFHLAYRLLDRTSREQFQNAHKDTEFPTFQQLFKFIKDRCLSMQLSSDINFDSIQTKPNSNIYNKGKNEMKFSKSKSSLVAQESKSKSHDQLQQSSNLVPCFICRIDSHGLLSCRQFCSADVKQRKAWLANWKGCFNCLSVKHKLDNCKSKWVCRWCKQKHNSMLCDNVLQNSVSNHQLPSTSNTSGSYCAAPGAYTTIDRGSHVLLGTALAEVLDDQGTYQAIRIVVDPASHYSFMTYKCAKRLGLSTNRCNVGISGIGQSSGGVKHSVSCNLKPMNKTAPILPMKALLLKSITSHLPTVSLQSQYWLKYCKFPLADPTFFESRPIDVLLGADLFSEIWLGGPIELDSDSPKLFPTVFGHIVIGKFSSGSSEHERSQGTSLITINPLSSDDININLCRFWETEEPKPIKVINPEDEYCEDHFKATHYRLEDGSYGVRLPFRTTPPEFTNISAIASRRFRNQENRLLKNDGIRESYHEFMREYEQLGHMVISKNPPAFIIPHHAISKVDRNQTKIRVVFDGSAQSVNGSLNDYLMVGPKLQTDIRDVLLNFRNHKCALVADIVKCFRGIWVHPDDRKYQAIFWRYNPYDSLRTYELNTVVYGLTSSPFLANRVIKAIVEDHGASYSEASTVLQRDIYVDDIVSGSDSIDGAAKLQNQLIELLGKAQFKLSKWASNCTELLQHVTDTIDQPVTIISKEDTSVKVLGLQWNPKTDCFCYNLALPPVNPTKRSILSTVSKIYDPLGFISPLVIMMKQFLQELWKLGVDWDDNVPADLATRWELALKQLPIISHISIPRFVRTETSSMYQIVGFSDASEAAYCAAIYLRVITQEQIKVSLLIAKTKLAPLKKLTIPRLELCGCFLLARLYQSIAEYLSVLQPLNLVAPRFFTDSTIALGWLHTPTYKLKTFVSNRVTEILQMTSIDEWFHVSSEDNPADAGSRGFFPDQLLSSKIWWNGPSWLTLPQDTWSLTTPTIQPDMSEIKGEKVALLSVNPPATFNSKFIVDIVSRFSSLNRLFRSLAHILRFVKNTRCKKGRLSGPLQLHEINSAQILCVKAVQTHFFFNNDLSEKSQSKIMKKFFKLNPFFDSSGILRAGGRLYNANLPYNHKHPVLLPPDNHFSVLVIDHFHRMYLHPGPHLLQALIQLEYWIPSARRLIRQRIYKCQRCYRLKAKLFIPKMGDLPSYRVKAARAFTRTGLDFAGPFSMKESGRRKAPVLKVYVCIFVCLTTKAVQLEAVTNLTADAFLAALDRFVSIRGLPSDLYSDCGSNFVSAAGTLKEWYKWYLRENTQTELMDRLTPLQINWHFNPPHAPHFGGIWEAGVKSAKYHMQRAVGDAVLTFEEFSTLFAKIGAALNSRPICPLSNDPAECDYLSPGHFLIGGPLIAIPEPTLLDVSLNRLDRWQLVKRMTQFFWDRWHREYLSTLQSRVKWNNSTPNLQVGDLVFLKDDNVRVLQWPRGRVTKVHPGRDGVVRVATVKTHTSTFCRPVAKLVPLFPENFANKSSADHSWNGWPQDQKN